MEGSVNNKGMRVLMITDTVGGVWSYALELCRSLLPKGLHFDLVTTGAPLQVWQRNEAEALPNVQVHETIFMLEWMDSPWGSIDASCQLLLQMESVLKPDLIHLNGFVYGSLSWKAPVLVVAHSDVWSWWHAVKKERPPQEWNEYFRRVQEGLQQAAYIVAPSKTMMKYLRELYAITTPGKVIYNGLPSEGFMQAEKMPLVFSMGRIWDEAKNIKLLLAAAPAIPFGIRLAGDNHFDGNGIETEMTNVTYLGRLPQAKIAEELSITSVYVHPAKYEPFGLSVLEAALSGCALVLGEIGSLVEIWGDSALYVDTDDKDALAAAVNLLMEDEDLRRQYAERAFRRAQKYTSAEMTKNYLELYRHMLENSFSNAR